MIMPIAKNLPPPAINDSEYIHRPEASSCSLHQLHMPESEELNVISSTIVDHLTARDSYAEDQCQNDALCPAEFDDVANFIDMGKLVGKDETNYFYSAANLSYRRMMDRIMILCKERRATSQLDNFDESLQSRIHYLSQCIKTSAYQGPTPHMRDGSPVKSIMKRRPTADNAASNCNTGPRVAFSHVNIREYERVPGDNPCVRTGVPLSIGWRHVQLNPIPLDKYELGKVPSRGEVEKVPAIFRRKILRDVFGVSINDINAAMRSANMTKRQRAQTLASEDIEVFQELLEELFQNAKSKFKVMNISDKESSTESHHDALVNKYLKQAVGEVEMELDEALFLRAKSVKDDTKIMTTE